MTDSNISIKNRIEALRRVLKSGGYRGVIVPLTDEHMSEYVGAYAQRVSYISGFAGSVGLVMVFDDCAAIFTDGRYTIQVREQVSADLYEYRDLDDQDPFTWLKSKVESGDRIAFDGELIRMPYRNKLAKAVTRKGASLVMTEGSLIDQIWTDQPLVPLAPAKIHDLKYAGESSQDKRYRLAAALKEEGIDAAPIMMLDSIAWLFNIRGADVSNTPVVRSAALLYSDGTAELFIESEKMTAEVAAHLGNEVSVQPRSSYYERLATIASEGKSILFDPETHNSRMEAILSEKGAHLIDQPDPCILAKAIKNETELNGAIKAHERDAVAVCKFLHWLDCEAPSGKLDELICVDKLWQFRLENDLLKDWSFDTISGAGPNGALCHYRVSAETNRPLEMDSLYLVDSGGQYLDGTTDITRTIPIGTPTAEMKDRFTRVLKGHIALATTYFAPGTSGHALDAFARAPLWQVGLDYDHGTGHGVGSFLAVHEGPQRIAKYGSDIALEPGMLLSNEPGYYKAGEYGIRIENLIYVTAIDDAGERPMLGFETLTLAPIDQRLIDISLLTDDELGWLNRYHAKVRSSLVGRLPDDVMHWLETATKPLQRTAQAA